MDNRAIPKASEIMTEATTLPAEMSIEQALALLERRGRADAPVLEGEMFVGMLSDLDCIRVLAAAAFDGLPTGTVADHMTHEVDRVSPDDDLFRIVELFLRTGHRRLPVVDARGALVGVLSPRDLASALARLGTPERRPEHPPGAAWDPNASDVRDHRRRH